MLELAASNYEIRCISLLNKKWIGRKKNEMEWKTQLGERQNKTNYQWKELKELILCDPDYLGSWPWRSSYVSFQGLHFSIYKIRSFRAKTPSTVYLFNKCWMLFWQMFIESLLCIRPYQALEIQINYPPFDNLLKLWIFFPEKQNKTRKEKQAKPQLLYIQFQGVCNLVPRLHGPQTKLFLLVSL